MYVVRQRSNRPAREQRRAGRARAPCALLACALLVASPAWAQGEIDDYPTEPYETEDAYEADEASGGPWLGLGSAGLTLLYFPVKLAYATTGLVVGGLAWAFSGGKTEVAAEVVRPAVRGDYVVTPDHLTGKSRLNFIGQPPAGRGASADVAPELESAPHDALPPVSAGSDARSREVHPEPDRKAAEPAPPGADPWSSGSSKSDREWRFVEDEDSEASAEPPSPWSDRSAKGDPVRPKTSPRASEESDENESPSVWIYEPPSRSSYP